MIPRLILGVREVLSRRGEALERCKVRLAGELRLLLLLPSWGLLLLLRRLNFLTKRVVRGNIAHGFSVLHDWRR